MPTILVAGSGHIGSTISYLLVSQPAYGYRVVLADLTAQPPLHVTPSQFLQYQQLDVRNKSQMAELIRQHSIDTVVSSLPYFLNQPAAEIAKDCQLNYFDLTEDIASTQAIAKLAQGAKTAFVPQCGIAPGFINIVAKELMQDFQELDSVSLRCGALPQQTHHSLQYALTWSIDGLINEYINPCTALVNRQPVCLPPLTDLEILQWDGAHYEAFNTSGGIGTMLDQYAGQVNTLNYKTLRYPGHCEKMRFLLQDLKLSTQRELLKKILLNTLPYTSQDVVIVTVIVQGRRHQPYLEEKHYFKKFYPVDKNGRHFTAIQMATASAACAVLDLVLQNPKEYRGFVHQTQFSLAKVLDNHFGAYLRE